MASSINERIAARVRGELATRGLSRESFYLGTGMSERTGARRLAGTSSWTTDELAATSAFLDIPMSALVGVDPAAEKVGA